MTGMIHTVSNVSAVLFRQIKHKMNYNMTWKLLSADRSLLPRLKFTEGGASFSKLTSSQNASRDDADEEETEPFFF